LLISFICLCQDPFTFLLVENLETQIIVLRLQFSILTCNIAFGKELA